jgi:hypothetical protein
MQELIMSNKFPHEMDLNPSKVEQMRRGKVEKAGFIATELVEEQEKVRRALMYHQVWGWQKATSYATAGILERSLTTR